MFAQWKRETSYKREESLDISAIRVKAAKREDRVFLNPEARNLIEIGKSFFCVLQNYIY